ncbi:DUF3592 domain-containing protein [Streptomyces sp. CLI2509]|nr:DUF3592 domain-containing protein [Streptomyces sp. CLI2509]MYX18675.1 DUF3592 domain-containing protein [Streptomyces sp. SID8380]
MRTKGRIERVGEPRHGGSPSDGIAVVVAFQDPPSGREFTVTNGGGPGERIDMAWRGREVGVAYPPPGRPHAFRFTRAPADGGRGLGWPTFAVLLCYAGLVVFAAIDRGRPSALLGFCGPRALSGLCHLPGNVRDRKRRLEAPTAMAAVPGRVIAALKSISTDENGNASTHVVPVVAFTTLDGTAVTAYCPPGLRDPAGSHGRDVTVHYTPEDPAVFTLDIGAERRSWKTDMTVNVVGLVVVGAAAVVGAVAL